VHQLLLMVVLAAVKGGQATIKTLAVAGPIVGSQSTFGRVELTAAAAQRVVITLVTSNPRLATAPADVIIAPGQNAQTFVVKTEPVAAPTTLTLTARTRGSPDATANFTVIPPALALLDCEPKSVPGGTHATCKAWMDGLVAARATPQIALSTSNAQVFSPAQPSVTVPAGSRSVTFDVNAAVLPQPAAATITAAYAGVTKSSNLSVTPAAISRFGCVVAYGSTENANGSAQCSVVGGDWNANGDIRLHTGFAVHLTAPAPPSGYKVPLTSTLGAPPNANGEDPPSLGDIPKTLEVPAGKDHAFYRLYTSPVGSTYIIKVSAKDPITDNLYETYLTVSPPRILHVQLESPISGVPLGGKEFRVRVEFQHAPPKHGIAYDVTYSGATDIQGPARVLINPPLDDKSTYFTVNIFPCALNPPCHVSVTLGGVTGTTTVNP
jgi:hypothetical protein